MNFTASGDSITSATEQKRRLQIGGVGLSMILLVATLGQLLAGRIG